MNRLIRVIVGLINRGLVLTRRTRLIHNRQEELYDSTANKDELLEPFREGHGHRGREVYLIGPRVSSDGIGRDEEVVEYMDRQRVQTEIKQHVLRRCDCGAVIMQGSWILGTCTVCARVLCQQEGCAARCEYCGALTCKRHSVKFGERSFCSRHQWYGLWLRWWGMLG